jgi:hypothetical protein
LPMKTKASCRRERLEDAHQRLLSMTYRSLSPIFYTSIY